MDRKFDWLSTNNLPTKAKELLDLFTKHNINKESVDENGDTFLHFFIRSIKFSQNDIVKVTNNLLDLGLDPNVKNQNEETFLQLAIAKRLNNVIDVLLAHNADINAIDKYGNSITHFFIKDEYVKCLKLDKLLTSRISSLGEIGTGKYLKSDDYQVSTTSMEKNSAVRNFVEWLISKGFDFDRKNGKGESALLLALKYNLQHILLVLLKHTRDIDFVSKYDKQTLLHLFIKTSNVWKFSKSRVCLMNFHKRYAVEIVKILLERGVSVDDVDAYGLTAIDMAINVEEQLDIVLMLIDRSTKLKDVYGGSLFHLVIRNFSSNVSKADYYVHILQILIDKGVDVNIKNKNQVTSIYYAVKEQNQHVIKLLKENDADFRVITNEGQNLFHVLANNAKYTSETLFDFLINIGCDANAKDEYGKSPLHLAVINGNVTMIEKLVSQKIDVNIQESLKNWTPLHFAVSDRRDFVKIVKLLVENGAKVNCKNRWDGRPLHIAADLKNGKNKLKLLLNHGAQVNARDHLGDSALARTFISGCVDNVELLLDYGADINDNGIFLLLWRGRCYKPIGKLLLKHWIKLRAANLYCLNGYKSLVGNDEYGIFSETCKEEVKILKATFIDSSTTLYQWLHMSVIRSYLYVHSEKLLEIIFSSTLRKNFPEYKTVILAHYYNSLSKKFLINSARKALLTLTRINLPDICVDYIFSNFSSADLVDFIEMVEPDFLP